MCFKDDLTIPGEVYRARDGKLGREVAIKVLPEEFATDAERLARFEREAKLLASLNHPNIASIHGFEESDGVNALVLELVEGPTLAERIKQGPIPVDETIAIAKQIAEALEAGHEAGVIHRDLKPANIKLKEDGTVKVLDYGLAKAMEGDSTSGADSQLSQSPTLTRQGTQVGVILGTAPYMSPEQSRGKPVDRRTDIWAFGAVVYEMLAGRQAFRGNDVAETLARILEREPDWSALPARTPVSMERLLRRCLRKDPKERLRDIGDARHELSDVELASGDARAAAPKARRWIVSAVVAAVLAALTGAAWWLTRSTDGPGVPRLVNPVQVTRSLGVEDMPAWSPNGDMLAYSTGSTAMRTRFDVWVTQVGTGQPVNRTPDHEGWDRSPSWSPDGTEVAFVSERDGGSILVMPVLAGAARRVASQSLSQGEYSSPYWSPDRKELAFLNRHDPDQHLARTDDPTVLEIVSLETGASRRIDLPRRHANPAVSDFAWSPDGRLAAYSIGHHGNEIARLWVTRLEDGEAFPVTEGLTKDHSASWMPDSRTLFFVSNRGGSRDVWLQRLGADGRPQGEPAPVTAGMGILEARLSPDGARLAYSTGGTVANLWRIRILNDRPATWDDAEQITFDQAFIDYVDVSPDGERLVVSSDRSGNMDLWTLPVEGGEMQQLTTNITPDWWPRWSPDGTQIAFYSYRSGNRDIWVTPASGGAPRQLTNHEGRDGAPEWSPDGTEILFVSNRTGLQGLWVLPEAGGEPRFVHSPGSLVAWSPDGRTIAFTSDADDVNLVPAGGGSPESFAKATPTAGVRWSRNGNYVYYSRQTGAQGDFFAVSVADRKERALTNLEGRRGHADLRALSTDGEYLYFVWREAFGDIWVMDVVTE